MERDVFLHKEGKAASLVFPSVLPDKSITWCFDVFRFICQLGLLHHGNMDVLCCHEVHQFCILALDAVDVDLAYIQFLFTAGGLLLMMCGGCS